MTNSWNRLLMLFAFAAVTVPAAAQYAPGMDGRANEATNQLSGVVGYGPPRTFINVGNLYVTGNVGGGRSFRGYSPIADSSSLLLTLPTSSLSNFQRDSFGLTNVSNYVYGPTYSVPNPYYAQPSPFVGEPMPYFNPSSTVSNVRDIERGLNMPGSSVPRSPFVTPNQPLHQFQGVSGLSRTGSNDFGAPISLESSEIFTDSAATTDDLSLLRRLDQGMESDSQPRLSFVMDALRSSPVFTQSINSAQSVQSRLARASEAAAAPSTYAVAPFAAQGAALAERRLDPLVRQTRVVDNSLRQAPTSEQMMASSRELVSPTAIAPRLFDAPMTDTQRDPLTGRPLPTPSRYLAVPEDTTQDLVAGRDLPAQPTPSLQSDQPSFITFHGATGEADEALGPVPAGDDQAFTDENPLASLAYAVQWLSDVQEDPELRQEVSALGSLRERYERAVAIVQDVSGTEIETLVGRGESKVDELISRAEAKVREGNYYQASTLYGLAATFDRSNPLIRLGHAHALLAAGEYLSAVLHLTNAIEQYPAFGYLKLNLHEFIPDPVALDVRRADLEKRLSAREDYRLRFLLGYIEHYSGLSKFGLPNLRKAAEEAPEGSVISRFPAMLERAVEPPASDEAPLPTTP